MSESIVQLDNWCAFCGDGPLPSMRSARLRVAGCPSQARESTNRDGSSYVSEFTPPLRRFASRSGERRVFTPAP
ncbi:MAG: hypothetical protein IPL19_27965 [Sandaracinaceae bacterium]|nr:hypothetical protein [Sandaracinaceae bacterium]MBK7154354.1 hypothetical protein [Sandaracinaceae bacterium]MBK8411796.1 hypothetical protein [Sandaracinaceae bacterium]MBK8589843.1 hypothetical protein [Sandaracinaceae bacterium]